MEIVVISWGKPFLADVLVEGDMGSWMPVLPAIRYHG
jgi:hypothetical protein